MTGEIAVRQGGPLAEGEWAQLAQVVNTIANTEFVPKGLRGNKPAVMAAVLYGRDQGLSPMVALAEVHMVDGKPTMSAALIAGKVRMAGHKVWREAVYDGENNVVGVTAHGERTDGTRDSFTFTLDMARRAGLAGKQNWKNYPEAMLWARACTQLARMLFSDVFIGSVYTADEMGAETDEDGAVLTGEIMDDEVRATGAPLSESEEKEPKADVGAGPAVSPVSQADPTESGSTLATGPEDAAEASSGSMISQAQITRLYTIATKQAMPDDEVKRIMFEIAGVASAKELRRSEYDLVVATVKKWEPTVSFTDMLPADVKGSAA